MENFPYQLLDCGDEKKLEQVGPFRFVRPAGQAVWQPSMAAGEWSKADAVFERFAGGDGKWQKFHDKIPAQWVIEVAEIRFLMQQTDFGHLGIFAEQQHNWQTIRGLARAGKKKDDDFNVLNLFAYTGGSTIAAAQGGAKVVHLDASKTSVAWAKENASLNSLSEAPVRWIVDDVQKFVARELRRGHKYNGIILDPPSFGRGTKNELWKIEEHLPLLLVDLAKLLKDSGGFVMLSAHSPGFGPLALENLLRAAMGRSKASYTGHEMYIPAKFGLPLPSGASCLMTF